MQRPPDRRGREPGPCRRRFVQQSRRHHLVARGARRNPTLSGRDRVLRAARHHQFARAIAVLDAWFQAEAGHIAEALDESAALADVLQSVGDITFVWARALQLRAVRRARLA